MAISSFDASAARALLAAPFPADVVQCRPGPISKDGKKAAVLWFIDARAVMDRLDDVFGVGGWKDEYRTDLDKKMVTCRLWFKADEWCFHEDVGGESDQPDEGDRHKAAFSDALKRAAVKLGIGRYLYDIPFFQHPLSPNGKYFDRENPPRLPAQFLPKPALSPALKSKAAADWAVANYKAAKTPDDISKVDAIILERKGASVMTPDDAGRADAARRDAELRTRPQ